MFNAVEFWFCLKRGTLDQRSDSGVMPVKVTEHWHRLAMVESPSLDILKGQSGHGPGQPVVLLALPEWGFGPDDLQSCLPTSNILWWCHLSQMYFAGFDQLTLRSVALNALWNLINVVQFCNNTGTSQCSHITHWHIITLSSLVLAVVFDFDVWMFLMSLRKPGFFCRAFDAYLQCLKLLIFEICFMV